jgi:hypothetical protein
MLIAHSVTNRKTVIGVITAVITSNFEKLDWPEDYITGIL